MSTRLERRAAARLDHVRADLCRCCGSLRVNASHCAKHRRFANEVHNTLTCPLARPEVLPMPRVPTPKPMPEPVDLPGAWVRGSPPRHSPSVNCSHAVVTRMNGSANGLVCRCGEFVAYACVGEDCVSMFCGECAPQRSMVRQGAS